MAVGQQVHEIFANEWLAPANIDLEHLQGGHLVDELEAFFMGQFILRCPP